MGQPFEAVAEKAGILKMDYQQRNWINKYLMPDEYVVWNGRPGKGHLLTPHDIFMIPFSIMWCGFAIVWETTVLIMSAPFFFKLWGIPFVCVGLFMVFGRFMLKSYIRKQTIYVITNKRIFSFRKNQIQTLNYHMNPTRNVTQYQDGSGNIRFYSTPTFNTLLPAMDTLTSLFSSMQSFRQNYQYFELENIPDVDRVLQILSN